MKVRSFYEEVDQLIMRTKNATVKNKTRSNDFVQIGTPPGTIITKWASWLSVTSYYSKNMPGIQKIVRDWTGAIILVAQAKEIVEKSDITRALIDIENCYSCLTSIIFELENSDCGILKTFKSINELNFGSDPCGINNYLKKRLEKNEIIDILNCHRTEISPYMCSLLQKCQGTSSAVERSFSILKKLPVKDRNFNTENIRKYITIYYNSSTNNKDKIDFR